jgi:UPF0755 protein
VRLGPILILAGAVVCCAVAVGSFVWQGNLPYQGYAEGSTVVVIEPGDTARTAAGRLERAGVVRNALLFRVLMRVRASDGKILAGEYEFRGRKTPAQVLDVLLRGEVMRHRLTIPEGMRLDEIARVVGASGLGREDAFLRAASDPRLVADIDPEATDLEGYLFPDTYRVPRALPETRLVAEMVDRFRSGMTPERERLRAALGLTWRQTLTLASLVEEEARVAEERPRIAAVFHNRLRMRMPLQCDPTVVYALVRDRKYRGEIFRSDLAHPSPYNTYVNPGLPPGPICNPGADSIDAVLRPAESEELYFVVSTPGRHTFSTNLKDHSAAVRRYRAQSSRGR